MLYRICACKNFGETRYLQLQSFYWTLTVAFWVAKQQGYCGWLGDGWPTGESWDWLHGRSTPLQPLYLFVQINTTNNKLGNARET